MQGAMKLPSSSRHIRQTFFGGLPSTGLDVVFCDDLLTSGFSYILS